MKSILETIKESQVNECGGGGYSYGGSGGRGGYGGCGGRGGYGGCGGRGGYGGCGGRVYAPVNKNYKSPREKDEEKKTLKKEHPDVIKKFEQLYKEYHALLEKASGIEMQLQALKSDYPALDYFTWKKK